MPENIEELKKIITELRETNQKLSRLAEWQKGILERIPDPVWVYSFKPSIKLVYMNPAIVSILGYTSEEIAKLSIRDVLSPKYVRLFKKRVREIQQKIDSGELKGTEVFREEVEYITKNGRTVWADIIATCFFDRNGKPFVIGISRDITLRKEAETALEKSEEKYRMLFESSMDAVYITSKQGDIIDVNQAAVDLFGFDSKKELLAIPIQDLYADPEDRKKFQEYIQKEGFVKNYPLRFRKKDGKIIDCLLTSSVKKDESGNITGYQGLIRDISEEKKLQKQLITAQKMEAIGTMAGGIAHNFNNMLMTIQGNVSLLLLKIPKDDPAYSRLKKIEQAVGSASKLTNSLLEIAKEKKPDMRISDLNEIVNQAVSIFAHSRKEILVKTELAPDLAPVMVDPGQIEQVLMNLFINAWQAMPEGGRLHVKTTNARADKFQIGPFQDKAGDFILISVTDTGSGIEEEALPKIFEPFYTTKNQGTGLGLSTVYAIIKQHNGYITVYSQKNKGTTFKIYLPAIRQITEKSEKDAIEEELYLYHGKGRILIIDDEDIVIETACEMLEELGYNPLQAKDLPEGIAILEKEKADIDLIILDLIMPDTSGAEAFTRIKNTAPEVKVLLASGYGQNREVDEILAMGCNGFIQKPFSISTLSQTLRSILGNP